QLSCGKLERKIGGRAQAIVFAGLSAATWPAAQRAGNYSRAATNFALRCATARPGLRLEPSRETRSDPQAAELGHRARPLPDAVELHSQLARTTRSVQVRL